MKEYDIVIIGAGSGGLVAATTAKRKGLKTALIEKNKIGGECTHYGCVPSKALLNSAKMFEATKRLSEKYGINGINISGNLDFGKVMEHVDSIVQGVYAGETPDIFEKQGIDVFIEKDGARFLDSNKMQIGDEIITFRYAVICSGSSPKTIDIPGSDEVDFLHNENVWAIRELPESIVFIGGGVISAEMGQALANFGSKVYIFDHNDEILKVLDDDAREIIKSSFIKSGIALITSADLKSFIKAGTRTTVTFQQNGKPKEISADKIFLAMGRNPNIAGMDLEKAGIAYTEKGITTNEFLQTSNSAIYACGDVTTPAKFTHTASHQANIVIKNILEGNTKKNDLSILPWAIFTDPEIAHVGFSEEQARQKFGNYIQVFKVEATIDRFVTDGNTTGFLKVIFNEDNLVIGADAIGAHAGEWIQLITLAIKNSISAETMADTIFSYPTYSEIVKKAFTRFLRAKD
ncbi:MAG: pyridine nucleotide-disulfide oxidoreductase [Chloroflexi bacterium HGW-Chloroflexi-5]|jgi:pyruvate/2-oxoglutarate dehydrogenase complex dihydrolipoamide dehydrogenase (E3) component|nr:MAG: pyridine nucleotide-disulfide oxidoreductase [Chloroflexi bacterium HGW-Chloroflexi-5]